MGERSDESERGAFSDEETMRWSEGDSTQRPDPGRAETIIADWIAGASAQRGSFEELCAAHPTLEVELRILHEAWQRAENILAEGPLLARRLVESTAGIEPGPKRYEVRGEVGRGGMGLVKRVWDKSLRRSLAMKVLLASDSGSDGRTLSRFLEEAQVTGQLEHPGIVPVHELGLDAEGKVYFTMRLVRGRTLADVLEAVQAGEEGWTTTRALGVLLRVSEAMAYAHANGVIHRDLKPSNIMVGQFGEVYVMDWGLARVIDQEDLHDIRIEDPSRLTVSSARGEESSDSPLWTMDGDVIGTPAYMPPEQARGEVESVGTQADVYALGAILYLLLVGERPYAQEVTPHDVLKAVLKGRPQPVAKLNPRAPQELVAICERAMQRVPEERYPDMSTLGEDLRAYLETRVVRAYESGSIAELRKWVQRNKLAAASLAAALAAALGGLGGVGYVEAAARNDLQAANTVIRTERESLALTLESLKRLSALQDLEDLRSEAVSLWPPYPEKADAMRGWIERARSLLADLPLHRVTLAEIRELATPRSPEQVVFDRERHPRFKELSNLEARIELERQARAVRAGEEFGWLPDLDPDRTPSDPGTLNTMAWERIKPGRTRFGLEREALALVERGLAIAEERQADNKLQASLYRTYSHALFLVGRDEEALAMSEIALELAPPGSRASYESGLADMRESIRDASSPAGEERVEQRLATLEEERVALRAVLDERRDWHFPEEHREARWWNNQLEKLVGELQDLADDETGLLGRGTHSQHGWGVERRLEWADRLAEDSIAGDVPSARWDAAMESIGLLEIYGGLEIEPQMGLVPLAEPDPESGLWEFWHVLSGDEPVRGEEGRLVLTEETGIVLVLLPGGDFLMGAQSTNPSGPNYDPDAEQEEGPVHEVTLSPFFISKYEVTQAQWRRLSGQNPSVYGPHNWSSPYHWLSTGTADETHPVENISWDDCMRVLPRVGLVLPSEAQWEYATRAGTDTPFWSGFAGEELARVANIADDWRRQNGGPVNWEYETWSDGASVHMPVTALLPNPFGLHHVHGNAYEWCLDGYDPRFYVRSPRKDPIAAYEGVLYRSTRSGSLNQIAEGARSSNRNLNTPGTTGPDVGVRPAAAIQHPKVGK